MRTPGKGTFVRSFGIITQSGFLVNIQASPTEECGGVFASVPIGGIVFVGRAGGGRCTRVRGCAGCMRYMRYRGGVRSDVRDTVEMCGAGTLSHSGGRRCGAGLVQCGLCAGMGCALESTVGVEIRYARAGVCVGEYGGRGNTGRTAAMCFGAAG